MTAKKNLKNKKTHINKKTSQKTVPKRELSPKQIRRQVEIRKQFRIRCFLIGILLGFCICLLGFSIYKLVSIFSGYHSGEKEYEDLRQHVTEAPADPEDILNEIESIAAESTEESEEATKSFVPTTRIDLAALQELNSEAIGWIEIPETVLSYPLVHTADNNYYLTHTFKGEENKSGSIFMEAANSADFSDLHTIIYGHNMKDGSMFASLKNYESASYYQSHPYLYIDLEDGSHCYQIFSCHEALETDKTYTIGYAHDSAYESFLQTIKSSSLYDTGVEVSVNDSVISLSTCTNRGQSRFVVHAKKLY